MPTALRLAPAALALTALALVCSLATAPRAGAADVMWSVMQDDNQLVYGAGTQRDRALDVMKNVGVDAVRVTVLWEVVAPHRKPRRSHDPRSYPPGLWDRYDDVVRQATKRGIAVYFSVTAPGPKWAHAKTRDRANRRTWKPDAREFGRFVHALGTRYSGRYRDENGSRDVLPRVSWWGLFNEPNQGGWLTPQAAEFPGVRGSVPTSPALYRELLAESARALIRTRHADDLVLIGETAPLGVDPQGDRRPLRPALFLREMFCLDRRLRRYRGAQAKARRCERVGRLAVLDRLSRVAYGHHPYTKTLSPTTRDRHRDAISMANIKALPALLDKIARRTGLIPANMPVLLTEFGYETNPPDEFNGISPAQQAEYINVADYIAYRNPRVFATTQFQLVDVPPQTQFPRNSRQYWFTYQSGIFTAAGEPKPSADAYMMPFEARPAGGGRQLFWGQVRFTPNGAVQTVVLERKDGGSWQRIGEPISVSNHVGFWSVTRAAPSGSTWRATWVSPDGAQTRSSREITLR